MSDKRYVTNKKRKRKLSNNNNNNNNNKLFYFFPLFQSTQLCSSACSKRKCKHNTIESDNINTSR